jgi:adenylate cyclase class IV
MHNLELKVRCADAVALDELVARARDGGAVYVRAMTQRDTYFVVAHGRLKLREWHLDAAPATGHDQGDGADVEVGAAGATLIAYARPDQSGSRLSDYLLSPVPDPATMREALTRALGVRVVVAKRRLLYQWGHTRIHFDHVTDLGAFVELETLLDRFPPDDRDAAAEREHRAVAAEARGEHRVGDLCPPRARLVLLAGGEGEELRAQAGAAQDPEERVAVQPRDAVVGDDGVRVRRGDLRQPRGQRSERSLRDDHVVAGGPRRRGELHPHPPLFRV